MECFAVFCARSKSFVHNKAFARIVAEQFRFWDFEESDLEVLAKIEKETQSNSSNSVPLTWIHPAAFGEWVDKQTLTKGSLTGTMDDAEHIQLTTSFPFLFLSHLETKQ